jgi:predicted metal-dependent HD superfamily phosphohydrolase
MRSRKETWKLDRARFEAVWRAVGANHDNASASLADRYAEEHRAYHDAEHIAECLAWFDRVRELAERPAELEVALFFHDAIYEPLASDNEARSAEMFRQLAREAGVSTEATERIARLIDSTETHEATSGEAALLSDIDLAILGASPARYARYERDVRREYAAIDEASYRKGRAQVLRGFLERVEIYRTPRLAARLEAQARDNLGSALTALEPSQEGGDHARIHQDEAAGLGPSPQGT